MHAFDNAIGLEHEKPATIRCPQYSAVIARGNGFSRHYQTRQKLVQQPVLSQTTHFHGEKISGNARAVRVTELNSECIVIATRMEPLHS